MNTFISTQPYISHDLNCSQKIIQYWQDYWQKQDFIYNNILHIPLSTIKYIVLSKEKKSFYSNKIYDVILFVSPHAIKSYALNYDFLLAKQVWLIGKESYKIFHQYFGNYCKIKNINIILNEYQQNINGLWDIIIQQNILQGLKNIVVIKSNQGSQELYKKILNYNQKINIKYLYLYEKFYISIKKDIIKLSNQVGIYISSSDSLAYLDSLVINLNLHLYIKNNTINIYTKHQKIADIFYNNDKLKAKYKIYFL